MGAVRGLRGAPDPSFTLTALKKEMNVHAQLIVVWTLTASELPQLSYMTMAVAGVLKPHEPVRVKIKESDEK